MNSVQYEEICRFFLASRLGLPVEDISSPDIPNPKRPNLPAYKHQIDLYWESGDDLNLYLHIANAKWRTTDKVDQPEVLLLQKVKEKVGAHKAMIITNSGFTSGALAAAQDDGIALHVVSPAFDVALLPPQNRADIRTRLGELSGHSQTPLFAHQVVFRAFDLGRVPSTNSRETRVMTGYNTKIVTPTHTRSITTGNTRATTGTSGSTGGSHKAGGFGIRKK